MSSSRYSVSHIVGLTAFLLVCLLGGMLYFGGSAKARPEWDEQVSAAQRGAEERPDREVAPLSVRELSEEPAERGVVESRTEVQAQEKLAESTLVDSTTKLGTWEDLLESIRTAAETDKPHRMAWPHVVALSEMVAEQPSRAELSPMRLGLDAVLRASATESDFVRAAVLMALGMALPKSEAEGLAQEFVLGEPGELARSAWFVLALRQPAADSDLGGVDLGLFRHLDSRVSLDTWPTVIPYPEDSNLLELALPQLSPPRFYRGSKKGGDLVPSSQIREITATRETIVLTVFAVRAQRPGLARDMLMEWMWSSDMWRACVWSLSYAANSDPDLAAILRDHLLTRGLDNDAGQYLAEQLGGLAGRGDLVINMLQSELLDPSEAEGIREQLKDTHALFALGEIIASGQPELGEQAAELLIEAASSPTVIDSVKKLALVELANARPDRVGDAIELVLISEAGERTRKMAAVLAKTVQVADQQRMRDLLIASYSWGAGDSETHEAYVRSLMFLGGSDCVTFLRGVPPGDITDSQLARDLELYLAK